MICLSRVQALMANGWASKVIDSDNCIREAVKSGIQNS